MEYILDIIQIVLFIGIALITLRLFKGPRNLDRILSLDAIAVCLMGILVIRLIKDSSPFFIDLILVFSLLNFIGTVAYIYYLRNKKDQKP